MNKIYFIIASLLSCAADLRAADVKLCVQNTLCGDTSTKYASLYFTTNNPANAKVYCIVPQHYSNLLGPNGSVTYAKVASVLTTAGFTSSTSILPCSGFTKPAISVLPVIGLYASSSSVLKFVYIGSEAATTTREETIDSSYNYGQTFTIQNLNY